MTIGPKIRNIIWTLILVFPILTLATNDTRFEVADIEFEGSEYYLHTKFESPLAETIFEFWLCNSSSTRCVPFNSCKYSESEIRQEMNKDTYQNIRNDLDLFFIIHITSSVKFENFIGPFKSLLNEIDKTKNRENCTIDELQNLKDQVRIVNG